MIVFKDVTPQDKEIFDSFYKYKCLQNSESSFANLCAYAFLYYGQYAIVENCLVTRIHFERNKSLCYHYPIGPNGMDKAIERIIEDAQEQAYNLHFICEHSELPSRFAQRFRSEAKRDFLDYLYLREDLQNLKGKKLQAKRNHINKFNKLYSWQYEQLDKDSCFECMEVEEKWCKSSIERHPEAEEEYLNEKRVIEFLLNNFEQLGIFGGAIKIEGRIVAFSLGSKINDNTFDTHIEKADRDIEGAFAIINQQIALHLPENYIYINREEDLGMEGLRQAKLSYHPFRMIEKHIHTLIP